MSTIKDNEQLEKLKSNDIKIAHQTLQYFYVEHWDYAKGFMKKEGMNKMDYEDMYQDAMAIFYKKTRNPSFNLSSTLKTFLLGIVKNLILAQRRKNKRVGAQEIEDLQLVADDFEEIYLLQERKNVLLQKMESLGSKCFEVLNLYYFEQLSMKEIASVMKYASVQVAKNKKGHCLNQLKHIISK